MINVWIQLKAKPLKNRALKSVLLKAITHAEGLLRYEIFQQTEDENSFSILETFESQDAIDRHYLTHEYLSWRKQLDELIEEGSGTDYDVLYSSAV